MTEPRRFFRSPEALDLAPKQAREGIAALPPSRLLPSRLGDPRCRAIPARFVRDAMQVRTIDVDRPEIADVRISRASREQELAAVRRPGRPQCNPALRASRERVETRSIRMHEVQLMQAAPRLRGHRQRDPLTIGRPHGFPDVSARADACEGRTVHVRDVDGPRRVRPESAMGRDHRDRMPLRRPSRRSPSERHDLEPAFVRRIKPPPSEARREYSPTEVPSVGSNASVTIRVPPSDHTPPGRMNDGSGGRTRYPEPSTLKIPVVPLSFGAGAKSRNCVPSGDRRAASKTSWIGSSTLPPASIRYTSPRSAPGGKKLKTIAWRSGDALVAVAGCAAANAVRTAEASATTNPRATMPCRIERNTFLVPITPPFRVEAATVGGPGSAPEAGEPSIRRGEPSDGFTREGTRVPPARDDASPARPPVRVW